MPKLLGAMPGAPILTLNLVSRRNPRRSQSALASRLQRPSRPGPTTRIAAVAVNVGTKFLPLVGSGLGAGPPSAVHPDTERVGRAGAAVASAGEVPGVLLYELDRRRQLDVGQPAVVVTAGA